MKNLILISLLLLAFAVGSCMRESGASQTETVSTDTIARVARGEYLVNAIGCEDCHSPKRMGPQGPEIIEELHLSGFRSGNLLPEIDTNNLNNGWVMFNDDFTSAVGPWGISYAANLTSDATGIGNWTEENFMRAIRHGKYKGLEGSRDLLPPMPWTVYRNLTDEDIKSIFAYLKTTKPVNNIVPSPVGPGEMLSHK